MKAHLLAAAYGLMPSGDMTDENLARVMKALDMLRPINFPQATDEDLQWVRKRLESEIGVTMVPGEDLHTEDHQPWLADAKGSLQWEYWRAYSTYLKLGGFNPKALSVLDDDTDNILDLCGNPSDTQPWGIRGLVMGDVQSGKTANYCGLINKAADAGYKVIVLLTGMIEDLRAQSQERLDSGFVGLDSCGIFGKTERKRQTIGVSAYRQNAPTPNALTSIDSDFLTANQRALQGIPLANIQAPVLLVMKKNVSPLTNLLTFLSNQIKNAARGEKIDVPFLLIDDEADNASVNAKKDEDPATINKLIRTILAKFVRSSYVAYTATPFANVFINPDIEDLFPESFVYALKTPTNYIGASSIFSEEGEHAYQVRNIEDAADILPWKHTKTLTISRLPPSLSTAMHAFLLSCAVRDLRAEPLKHRSMLVNVTRFTDVQTRLAEVLRTELYEMLEEIRQYLAADELWARHPRLVQLYDTWLEEYSETEFSWDAIRMTLYASVASIKVVTVNQKTAESDRLNYSAYRDTEKGRRVIAVGGLTLSRGLTLEGLCVSYFLRNSKAYDTLLQMGRWFGYRTDYADLCRVWMDPEIQDWFSYVAGVINELRQDIRSMHQHGKPPKHFGMRVKSHPGAMIVTALNKMRNAREVEVSVSFSGCGAETPYLPRSIETNQENVRAIAEFLDGLGAVQMDQNEHFLWPNVPAELIGDLLQRLDISGMNAAFMQELETGTRPLARFIGSNTHPALQYWDVALPQGSGLEFVPDIEIVLPHGTKSGVRPRMRQFEWVGPKSPYLKVNKLRVGEASDELAGMSDEIRRQAKADWDNKRLVDKVSRNAPNYFYRRYRERPLLTISLVQPKDAEPPSADPVSKSRSSKPKRMMKATDIGPQVLVAVSVSFPHFDEAQEHETVYYRMNKIALKNMDLYEDDEGDNEYDTD